MTTDRRYNIVMVRATAVLTCAAFTASMTSAQTAFRLEEATIASVRAALEEGRLSCRQLTDFYLQRIEAYDR